MSRSWLIAALVAGVTFTLVPADADAKRLGGARSSGMQRTTPATPPQNTPATPAATPNTPANSPAAAAAPSAGATADAPLSSLSAKPR